MASVMIFTTRRSAEMMAAIAFARMAILASTAPSIYQIVLYLLSTGIGLVMASVMIFTTRRSANMMAAIAFHARMAISASTAPSIYQIVLHLFQSPNILLATAFVMIFTIRRSVEMMAAIAFHARMAISASNAPSIYQIVLYLFQSPNILLATASVMIFTTRRSVEMMAAIASKGIWCCILEKAMNWFKRQDVWLTT
jgi:hypothetical protein